jgi:predicted dehydrogenase
MTPLTEPPLNDLWTIPGEEYLLTQFQQEDRDLFHRIDPVGHYHGLQIQDFLRAVVEDRPPAVTGEDGRRVVAMFTAIYRSQRERRPIEFPLSPEE